MSFPKGRDSLRYKEWSRRQINQVFNYPFWSYEDPTLNTTSPETNIDFLHTQFSNQTCFLHTVTRHLREIPRKVIPEACKGSRICRLVDYIGSIERFQISNRILLKETDFADVRFAGLQRDDELRNIFIYSGFDFAKGLGLLCDFAIQGARRAKHTGIWLSAVVADDVKRSKTSVPFRKDSVFQSTLPVLPSGDKRITDGNWGEVQAKLDTVQIERGQHGTIVLPSNTRNYPSGHQPRVAFAPVGFDDRFHTNPNAHAAYAYQKRGVVPAESLTDVRNMVTWEGVPDTTLAQPTYHIVNPKIKEPKGAHVLQQQGDTPMQDATYVPRYRRRGDPVIESKGVDSVWYIAGAAALGAVVLIAR